MCYATDKLIPLALAIKPHMPLYEKTTADTMIKEHVQPLRGQRSEIVKLAEKFFEDRRKLGLNESLCSIRGDKPSALREAIMLLLHEQAGTRMVSA